MTREIRLVVFNRIGLARPTANFVNTLNTCAELARAGVDVTIYGDLCGTQPEQVLSAFGVEPMPNLQLLHTTWGFHAASAPLAAPGLLRAEPSAANVALFSEVRGYAPALMRASRRRGFATIFEAHNPAGRIAWEDAARCRPARRSAVRHAMTREALEREILSLCDAVVVPNPRTLEMIRPLVGPRVPLVLLPNGTRVVRSAPGSVKDIDVLYAGSLKPWKGVETVIQAVARLAPYQLTVLGGRDGSEREELRNLARSLGCAERITFHPGVPPAQVRSFYERARVGLVPLASRFIEAREYTCPVKLMEMMGAGLAIVAARLPSIEEFVHDGVEVLLAASDDPRDWASAILRLLEQPGIADRLSGAAREKAVRFTYERRASTLAKTIASVPRSSPPNPGPCPPPRVRKPVTPWSAGRPQASPSGS
ncbi:MAG: glycosyltransferase family 4 protein [Acidobacteria bacterium]|nr:glycosyltransferase family 4 protein [Acidobacteriota bacterium]